jgi:uncharacterized FAD-dependent dehydrogenase
MTSETGVCQGAAGLVRFLSFMDDARLTSCDVAIVGTGPAGMFAALELLERRPGTRVVMFERGPIRPMGDKDNVTAGWGGAGAFSDGKLDLSSVVGGTIHEEIGQEAFDRLIPHIDARYLFFGGDHTRMIDARRDAERWTRVQQLKAKSLGSGLDLRPFPIRHLGTDTAHAIVTNIRRYLLNRGVEIRVDCGVEKIEPVEGGFLLTTEHGDRIRAGLTLAAPGRSGAEWMAGQAKALGLKLMNNGIDVGVRVEVPNETLKEITDLLYESKIIYHSRKSDDKLRTFCMCPSGYVAMEDYRGLKTVNGHSFADKRSLNTNFAILATQVFTEPFNDSLGYGKDISGLANKLAGGAVLVQRLGDLRKGRRSKIEKMASWVVQPTLPPPAAVPGDLGLAIPHRHLADIVEMLEALDHIAPGIASDHTLLYGIEVKFYSYKIETMKGFETAIPGLYVAGDGSGYTRGLLQSSMQGVLAARHIAERLPRKLAPEVSVAERTWEHLLKERYRSIVENAPEEEMRVYEDACRLMCER